MKRGTGAPYKNALRIQIGKAIQRHRRDRGYTQGELADSTGLSLKYIGEVERGHANFSIDVVERIADVLDWNPVEAMGGVRAPLGEGVRAMVVSETEHVRERLGSMVAWLQAIEPAAATMAGEPVRRRSSRAR